jgi:holliday junction DNA helicase RuvA
VIAALRGVLRDKGRNYLVVSAGAFDLKVLVPATLLTTETAPGDRIELFTYLHVRESDISLYGFEGVGQRDLFTLLLEVNGVGPRSALSLLSVLSTDVLTMAIAEGKGEVLARAPGIGLKTAQRIVLHLQDKVVAQGLGETSVLTQADEDVIAALTSLGYRLIEAQRAVQLLPRDVTDVEARLKLALERFGARH